LSKRIQAIKETGTANNIFISSQSPGTKTIAVLKFKNAMMVVANQEKKLSLKEDKVSLGIKLL
jgi:hypothetical protein